jgi:hypothetical protein
LRSYAVGYYRDMENLFIDGVMREYPKLPHEL